jgi:hypothetical protein
MPKGSEKTDEWSIYNIDQDGNIKYITSIPPRFLPDAFVYRREEPSTWSRTLFRGMGTKTSKSMKFIN